MKVKILLIVVAFPTLVFGQNVRAMGEVEGRNELSMSEVNGKTSAGVYRYYAKGETAPFTGVLYSKHDNGNFSSWQEYVDGVGEGTWINYYENGEYKEIGTYQQNLVEGPIKKFYPNGQLKAKGNYKDWRIRVGEWKYYNEQGQLVKVEDYGSKGSLEEVTAYYERGEISYSWYSRIKSKNGF